MRACGARWLVTPHATGACMHADGRDRAPWVLRWLQADLPARLGRPQESVDRYYSLFDFCASQLQLYDSSGVTTCMSMSIAACMASLVQQHKLRQVAIIMCSGLCPAVSP